MHIYNPHTFKPARGGHAPGHLRDGFLDAIEAAHKRGTADPVVNVGYDERPLSLSQLCGLLWNCTDIMPGDICAIVDLPPGTTYARAARALRAA